MKKEYLYIGFDGTGYFKIGITKNVSSRLKQIRTGNPTFTYLWVFECDNPQVSELEFHTKFYSKRISGEWFKLTHDDLKFILGKFHKEVEIDFENSWNEIVNNKNALDKQFIENSNNYWLSFK